MRRDRLLPLLPPLLLAVVACAQLVLAHTTPLTPWKLGGFGMFSTSDHAGARTLRASVETDAGAFLVVGTLGSPWVRTWPRSSVLRAVAAEAACGRWALTPVEDFEAVAFPSPAWARVYDTPRLRAMTEASGFAMPADSAVAPVTGARATVTRLRLDISGSPSRLVTDVVATEAVDRAEAGC